MSTVEVFGFQSPGCQYYKNLILCRGWWNQIRQWFIRLIKYYLKVSNTTLFEEGFSINFEFSTSFKKL